MILLFCFIVFFIAVHQGCGRGAAQRAAQQRTRVQSTVLSWWWCCGGLALHILYCITVVSSIKAITKKNNLLATAARRFWGPASGKCRRWECQTVPGPSSRRTSFYLQSATSRLVSFIRSVGTYCTVSVPACLTAAMNRSGGAPLACWGRRKKLKGRVLSWRACR